MLDFMNTFFNFLKVLDFYVHIVGTLSYLINELLMIFWSPGFESMLVNFFMFLESGWDYARNFNLS
jgi:hypothetical protein